MQIAELAIEVRNDQTNSRADENLIEHDPDTETKEHRHALVARPHKEVGRHIGSRRNACFLHRSHQKLKNVSDQTLKNLSNVTDALESKICFLFGARVNVDLRILLARPDAEEQNEQKVDDRQPDDQHPPLRPADVGQTAAERHQVGNAKCE